MNERGISAVFVMIFLIFLSILSISIVWLVFLNISSNFSGDIEISKLNVKLDIDPQSVVVGDVDENGNYSVSFRVLREVGQGNLDSMMLIFSNGGSSYSELVDTDLKELDQRVFTIVLDNSKISRNLLTGLGTMVVVPVIKSESGKLIYSAISAEYNFKTESVGSVSTAGFSLGGVGGSSGGSSGGGSSGGSEEEEEDDEDIDDELIYSGVYIRNIYTYGNYETGSVIVRLANQTGNENVTIYIKNSTEDWRRVHDGVKYDGNSYASSIFDLNDNTNYSVKVFVSNGSDTLAQNYSSFFTKSDWSLTSPLRNVEVSNDSELESALEDIRAGDHIILENGSYTTQISLSNEVSSPNSKIVFRSQNLSNPAILNGGVYIEGSSGISFYGLVISGPDASVIYLRNSNNIDIVSNVIDDRANLTRGGGNSDNQAILVSKINEFSGNDKRSNILIMNNIIEDKSVDRMERLYYGIKIDNLRGDETVYTNFTGGFDSIKDNTIRGFYDGISNGGDEKENPRVNEYTNDTIFIWGNQNIDIYNNVIYDMYDDCIETDGHMINGRIYNNYLGKSVNALTFAPMTPGPYFVVRNYMAGFNEGAIKLNTADSEGSSNIYYYHNTIVQGNSSHWTNTSIYKGYPANSKNVIFRNNIIQSLGRVYNTDIRTNVVCDWYHTNHDYDYDLMYSTLLTENVDTIFKWGYSHYYEPYGFFYKNLSDMRIGTSNLSQTFECSDQRVIPIEMNGIYANPQLSFIGISGITSDNPVGETSTTNGTYTMTINSSSPAIDSAVRLYGINDVYSGSSPDIGAYEYYDSNLDKDRDGYVTSVDCNDFDGDINPGSEEVCYNGYDDDCDGVQDEGCSLSIASCVLNSALWSDNDVFDGETVYMNVDSDYCDDQEYNYTIYESDGIISQYITSYVSSLTSLSWVSDYYGDWIGNPEFYFDVFPTSDEDLVVRSDSLTVRLPVCGNSVLEYGEQCDDGGTVDGDGCSSVCLNEPDSAEPLITKRFGECATCDVSGSMDSGISSYLKNNHIGGTSTTIVLRDMSGNSAGILFYFNLSSIPQGSVVRDARLVMFNDLSSIASDRGVKKKIYLLNETTSYGLWSESNVSYNNRSSGVAWTSNGGNIFNITQESSYVYMKTYYTSYATDFYDANVTSAVQYWVSNPEKNLGMLVAENGTGVNTAFMTKENSNTLRRPYLQITYESEQDEYIPQAYDINVSYHSGQTFIRWNEVTSGKNETSYKIYRYSQAINSDNIDSAELIGQVYQGSSYMSDSIYGGDSNVKQANLSKIGISLDSDNGLFVYSVRNNSSGYYAVTSVVEGNENRAINVGNNSLSSSVSETIDVPDFFYFGSYGDKQGYVVWLSDFNPLNLSDSYGFTNQKSMPFFFSIYYPQKVTRSYPSRPYLDQGFEEEYFLWMNLHPSNGDYFSTAESYDNSLYVNSTHYGGFSLGINDAQRVVFRDSEGNLRDLGTYIDSGYGYSYYFGWNRNYVPTTTNLGMIKSFDYVKPFNEEVNVPYTEKSIMFVIDILKDHSIWADYIDENRIYCGGGSLGAGGCIQLAVHYPDSFASVNAYQGKVNHLGGGQVGYMDNYIGTSNDSILMSNGLRTYDYINMSYMLINNPSTDYPPIRLVHGKNDSTVFWDDIPAFYNSLETVKAPYVAYWSMTGHNNFSENLFSEFINSRTFVGNISSQEFNPLNFRLNQSYLSFTGFSLNSIPGNGSWSDGDAYGGMNRFVSYNISSIGESASSYQVVVYLVSDSTSDSTLVDITPRRLQSFDNTPGNNYNWQNVRVSDSSVLQSGSASADINGIVSVNDFNISKSPSRLIITKI